MSNYPLRIDNNIMNKIKKLSLYEGRSINKEIEFILKKEIQKKEKEDPSIFQ